MVENVCKPQTQIFKGLLQFHLLRWSYAGKRNKKLKKNSRDDKAKTLHTVAGGKQVTAWRFLKNSQTELGKHWKGKPDEHSRTVSARAHFMT